MKILKKKGSIPPIMDFAFIVVSLILSIYVGHYFSYYIGVTLGIIAAYSFVNGMCLNAALDIVTIQNDIIDRLIKRQNISELNINNIRNNKMELENVK